MRDEMRCPGALYQSGTGDETEVGYYYDLRATNDRGSGKAGSIPVGSRKRVMGPDVSSLRADTTTRRPLLR